MSLGIPEILLILVLVLLLFGGKRIPELARAFANASNEYKKAKQIIQKETNEIKDAINSEINKEQELENSNQ